MTLINQDFCVCVCVFPLAPKTDLKNGEPVL